MKDDPNTDRLINMMEGIMKYRGLSYPQVAEMLAEKSGQPKTRQNFFKKVKNGSIRVTDLLEVLDLLGMQIRIESNGNIVPTSPAVGERVIRVVKGRRYDTKRACAISNTFFYDGVNKYRDHRADEFYYDAVYDEYYVVHYSDGDPAAGKRKFPWIEILDKGIMEES